MSSRFTHAERKLLMKGLLIFSENLEEATALLYNHLFEIEPDIKDLFAATDMHSQGQAVLGFLNTMVTSLAAISDIQPDVKALKQRHSDYGVRPEHYLSFGEALLISLANVLGDDFTAEMESAWMKVYTLVVISIRSAE